MYRQPTHVIQPPWHEDAATADRVWRVVLAALGPTSDQLWLRFGCLGEMDRFLPPDQVERMEALIGPYWGQPDPIRVPPEVKSGFDGLLSGIVGALEGKGLRKDDGEGSAVAPKYAPYSCAVVPVRSELIDLLVNLSVDPSEAEAMLERLADHWHLRKGDRDLLSTGDGMLGMGLDLTSEEAESLRSALAAAGLSPEILERSPW